MKNNTNNPRITFPLLGEAMFRALALEPGTSNANKWYRKFRLKRSNREKGNTLEDITFFRKISVGMNRSIYFSTGTTGFSIQMVSAPGLNEPSDLI